MALKVDEPDETPAAVCASCGHQAPAAEMKPELRFNWTPTGGVVCRDADACFDRWYARPKAEG